MSTQSHQPLPDSTDDEAMPTCFFLVGINHQGELEFESAWGETPEDIKLFANLMVAITNGGFDELIISQIRERCQADEVDKKNFALFHKTYKNSRNKIRSNNGNPTELVVDPMNVEL